MCTLPRSGLCLRAPGCCLLQAALRAHAPVLAAGCCPTLLSAITLAPRPDLVFCAVWRPVEALANA